MFRKNRILSASLVIFINTASHAGFYVGAGIGPDTVEFKDNSHVFSPGNFDVINKSQLSATGVFGTLFAGYGWLHNQFYLAGELNGNISSAASYAANDEYVHESFASTSLKVKNSIGISVLPGYQFTPTTLFYGRLGLTNSKIQVKTSDISLANASNRIDGFRYGLGIKQAISDRFAVRMDYSRINYHKFESGTFDVLGGVSKTTQRSTTQQLVEFGVVVNFA